MMIDYEEFLISLYEQGVDVNIYTKGGQAIVELNKDGLTRKAKRDTIEKALAATIANALFDKKLKVVK